MPQFFSVNEFSTHVHLSRITIFQKIKSNEIPCTRIGRRILIPASYLNELEERAKSSASKAEV